MESTSPYSTTKATSADQEAWKEHPQDNTQSTRMAAHHKMQRLCFGYKAHTGEITHNQGTQSHSDEQMERERSGIHHCRHDEIVVEFIYALYKEIPRTVQTDGVNIRPGRGGGDNSAGQFPAQRRLCKHGSCHIAAEMRTMVDDRLCRFEAKTKRCPKKHPSAAGTKLENSTAPPPARHTESSPYSRAHCSCAISWARSCLLLSPVGAGCTEAPLLGPSKTSFQGVEPRRWLD